MQVVNVKLVIGQSLVSLSYPDSKTNELVKRVGRVEFENDTTIKLFVGNGQYRTFTKSKIVGLQVIGG